MRRKRIHFLGFTVIFTVFLSGQLLFNSSDIFDTVTTPRTKDEFVFSLRTKKYVTKSLTELGKMDQVNKYFLFLNDVPKSGSEILILLLQRLQGINNYKHVRMRDGNKRHLIITQQEKLVDEVYDALKNQAVPLSFDRHVYFVNFTYFDKQLPTYINLIRNPVERTISRTPFFNKAGKKDFYYRCLFRKKNSCNFKSGRSYDLSIPYFCGHDPRCMQLNNPWALQEAKSNVDRYYPVVGVLEELNTTLKVLEQKIPYFFRGAFNVYEKKLLHMQKSRKKVNAPSSVRKLLEQTLVTEVEFYEWVKKRLFKQLQIK